MDTFDVNNIKSFLKEYDQKKIFIDQLNDILQNTHNALNVKQEFPAMNIGIGSNVFRLDKEEILIFRDMLKKIINKREKEIADLKIEFLFSKVY